MRERLNFQQQLQHHPKNMLWEQRIAGTQKQSGRGNLISQWKTNQHIWSHRMPDSRHALCWSSPIPCDSASQRQNSKITPTAPILPAVLPTPHKCHVEKQESPNPQQWAQCRLEYRNIPMKLLQQTSRSCQSMENFLLGQKPSSAFPHLTIHITAVYLQPSSQSDTSLYRTDPCTKEEE